MPMNSSDGIKYELKCGHCRCGKFACGQGCSHRLMMFGASTVLGLRVYNSRPMLLAQALMLHNMKRADDKQTQQTSSPAPEVCPRPEQQQEKAEHDGDGHVFPDQRLQHPQNHAGISAWQRGAEHFSKTGPMSTPRAPADAGPALSTHTASTLTSALPTSATCLRCSPETDRSAPQQHTLLAC